MSYFFSETVDSVSNGSFKNRISFWNCHNCLSCPRTLTNTRLDFQRQPTHQLCTFQRMSVIAPERISLWIVSFGCSMVVLFYQILIFKHFQLIKKLFNLHSNTKWSLVLIFFRYHFSLISRYLKRL